LWGHGGIKLSAAEDAGLGELLEPGAGSALSVLVVVSSILSITHQIVLVGILLLSRRSALGSLLLKLFVFLLHSFLTSFEILDLHGCLFKRLLLMCHILCQLLVLALRLIELFNLRLSHCQSLFKTLGRHLQSIDSPILLHILLE